MISETDQGAQWGLRWLPWAIFLLLWFVVAGLLIAGVRVSGNPPVDAATYFTALEDVSAGTNPYGSPDEATRTWLTYHAIEGAVLAGTLDAENLPFRPGPFIYPPTLLQFIDLLRIGPVGFVLLILASVLFFCGLWLRISGANPWWLLLVVFSWDVLASFSGANIELMLLATTLGAVWLLWKEQGLWAAPLIAFVVVVKPFYALLFLTFGVLMLSAEPDRRMRTTRMLLWSAAATIVLISFATVLWPNWLRWDAIEYLSQALAYSWYQLPVVDQTPMSIWNRTLMQGLVNGGVSAQMAQLLSMGLWLIVVVVSAWQAYNRRVGFTQIFALGFAIFYWFRPVGWTLIYLDFVVLTAIWPYAKIRERGILLSIALALNLSHWVALVLTVQQRWLRLFTLQSASVPWETWLVLPLCWILLLVAIRRLPTDRANRSMATSTCIPAEAAPADIDDGMGDAVQG
jgi:hypothetical protein